MGLTLTFCAILAGCGRQQRWPNPTVPTVAIVHLDGKPLANALVIFGPARAGHASQGTTDARGRATMTTFTPGDGAVAGMYRAMVSCEEVKPNPAVVLPDPMADLEGFRKAMEAAVNAGLPTHFRRQLLPAHYVSCDTSGLRVEIEPARDNVVMLELSSTAKPRPPPDTSP